MSSCNSLPYSALLENQRESQVRLTPRRSPIGLIFCPISILSKRLWRRAATSRTMIVMLANGFSIRPARPRARGLKRFNTMSLPTQAWATTRSSTSRSWLFSALAIADSSVFLTSTEILLLENSRSASAVATFLPRMSWATRLSFCGLTRSMRVVALASFSA